MSGTPARVLRHPGTAASPEHVGHGARVSSPTARAGLLGLAVSPTFADDSFVYVYLTAEDDNRIIRFRLLRDRHRSSADVEVVVDGIAKVRASTTAGELAFGPDGMLYAGTGDAAVPDGPRTPTASTARSCG